MNKQIHIALLALSVTLVFNSCSNQKEDTATSSGATRYKLYSGTLKISADASLESILKQQQQIFEFTYDSVQLIIDYKNENEVLNDFKTKNATAIVLARALEQAEKNDFKNFDTIYTREVPVAYDAVALIANKNFDNADLSMDKLKEYIAPHQKSKNNPQLVFEITQSSVVKYVLGVLGYQEKVSSNVYALQSAQEVIEYVTQNENAIGFVPYNLLSDGEDTRVVEILKRIKILCLRAKDKEGKEVCVSANQSDIAAGDYPLIRTWNAITRYTYSDNLEMLFITFLSKERAAKIFLKAGLIPVKVPEREIIVNDRPLGASSR